MRIGGSVLMLVGSRVKGVWGGEEGDGGTDGVSVYQGESLDGGGGDAALGSHRGSTESKQNVLRSS